MASNINMPHLGGLSHNSCKVGHRSVSSVTGQRKGPIAARPHHSRDAAVLLKSATTRLRAVAELATNSSKPDQRGLDIEVDNNADDGSTVISITGLSKPGLLAELTQTIQKLKLEVVKVPGY